MRLAARRVNYMEVIHNLFLAAWCISLAIDSKLSTANFALIKPRHKQLITQREDNRTDE